MRLFLDSSFLVALHNSNDPNHAKANSSFRNLWRDHPNLRPIYTDYIFDEFATILMVRLNKTKAIQICEKVLADPTLTMYSIDEARFEKTWRTFKKFKDKEWSFTDCSSYTIMKEFKIKDAASFDHHFKQFGFDILP
jgi:predicted nucleic acid-binding protein